MPATDIPLPTRLPENSPDLLSRLDSKLVARWNANFCYQEFNVTTAGTACLKDGDLVGTVIELKGGFDALAAANDATRGIWHSGKPRITAVTAAASSITQTVASTEGMIPGDNIYFGGANKAYRTVLSVTDLVTVVLTATISTAVGDEVRITNGCAGLPAFSFPTTGVLSSASTTFFDQFASTGFTCIVFAKPTGVVSTYRLFCSNGTTNIYFGLSPQSGSLDRIAAKVTAATEAKNNITTALIGNQTDSTPVTGNGSFAQNASVFYWTCSAALDVAVGKDGVEVGTTTGSGSLAGKIQIGASTTQFFCSAPIHEIAFYSGVLSAAEIQAETSRLMSLGTVADPLVIVDSNSYGRGYYNSADHTLNSMPALIKANLKGLYGNVNTVQLSVSGASTYEKTTNGSGSTSAANLKFLGNWNSYRKVAHLLLEGRNSMAQNGGNGASGVNGNRTGAEAWAETVTMGQLAQSYGQRNVFVWTVPVSIDQTTYDAIFEARRLAYNVLARAEAAKYGFILIDICALIPALDLTASLVDTAIYYTDKIHFQPATYAKICYHISKAIAARWASEAALIAA